VSVIPLSAWDLAIAAALVLLLAGLSWRLQLGQERSLLIAAGRSTVQLLLLGLVLKAIFAQTHYSWVILLGLVMLAVAGWEVFARQKHKYRGWWGYGIGSLSMFISSFGVTVLALTTMINAQPWYLPQYSIPLLGMLLGNTMTGVAVSLDNLTHNASERKGVIEARLMLGHDWHGAIADIRRDALRSGLIPIINSMAAAGIVSLPGMMTGQILAGSPPLEAAKYQLLILFLITAGTGLGSLAAVWIGAQRLFDERQRLRLERLT